MRQLHQLRSDDESPSTEVEIIVQDVSHDSDDVTKRSLWSFIDQQVAQASAKNSVSSELTIQMQQYLRVNNLERKQDPLEWWKRNCHLYPYISKLAKTSVPSERFFSDAPILILVSVLALILWYRLVTKFSYWY